MDLNILNMLLNPGEQLKPKEFLMEVTDKTRADVKVFLGNLIKIFWTLLQKLSMYSQILRVEH